MSSGETVFASVGVDLHVDCGRVLMAVAKLKNTETE